MPSGGARQPTPGTTYPNRTDLAAKAAPGQTYGQATQQVQAQRVVPMGAAPQSTGVEPGSLTALNAPSERPNEPVTHGVSSGPGAGPEVLGGMAVPGSDVVARLGAMYQIAPSPELFRLITQAKQDIDEGAPPL